MKKRSNQLKIWLLLCLWWEQRESNRVRNPLLPNIFYKSCFSSPTIGPTFRILYSAAVLLNELKHRKYKNDFLFSHYNF